MQNEPIRGQDEPMRGSIYLLKLATMMGMGSVMQRTPQMAHREPTSLPEAVSGATSPYPETEETQ